MPDILLVEDEHLIRKNLSMILYREGYSVTAAKNGDEALGLISHKSFDLVITDLMMPRTGGLELINHLNTHYPNIRIIITTAYPSAGSAIDAVKKGVFDYFIKPFDTAELLASVRKALKSRAGVDFNWKSLSAYGVTKKEEAILQLMIEEHMSETRVLAETLDVKETTVKQHLDNLYRKFNVNNRTALVTMVIDALRLGSAREVD